MHKVYICVCSSMTSHTHSHSHTLTHTHTHTHTHTLTHTHSHSYSHTLTHTHTQPSEEAVTIAMAYVALFLSHISNVTLMREFLRFLIRGKYDGKSVLNVVLHSVSSSNVKVGPA